MKLFTILSVAALTLATVTAKAQGDIPSPEFKNKVMYVKKDNTLTELENADLKTEMKTSMTGGAKVNIVAAGNHSSVKRSGSPKNRFIILLEPGIDPQSAVELLKFDQEKKTRKMVANAMGTAKKKDIPKQQLTFTKVRDAVYLISPAEQLEPGEYIFMINRPNVDVMSAGTGSLKGGFGFYVEGRDSE